MSQPVEYLHENPPGQSDARRIFEKQRAAYRADPYPD